MTNDGWDFRSFTEDLYPEIYRRLYPYINDITDLQVKNALTDIYYFDSLISSAIIKSGILRNPPANHNAGTIKDVAKTMLAGRLESYEI